MGSKPTRATAGAPVPLPRERVFSFLGGGAAATSITLVLIVASAAACTDVRTGARTNAATHEVEAVHSVTDDVGHTLRISGPARRVVSLLPSVTELLLEMDAADRIVARTDFDRDPRIGSVPSLGHTLWPSLEAIVGVEPDLVVAGTDAAATGLRDRLSALGVPVWTVDLDALADVARSARGLGRLLGLRAEAEVFASRFERRLAAARARWRTVDPPRVVYLLWTTPPRVPGAGTYVDELIAVGGGRNAFADVAQPWPEIPLEELVRRDPEVLVVPEGLATDFARRPVWRDLRAVREGHVLVVPGDLFERPGPHVIEAIDRLGSALRRWSKERVAGNGR